MKKIEKFVEKYGKMPETVRFFGISPHSFPEISKKSRIFREIPRIISDKSDISIPKSIIDPILRSEPSAPTPKVKKLSPQRLLVKCVL